MIFMNFSISRNTENEPRFFQKGGGGGGQSKNHEGRAGTGAVK